MRSFAKCEQTIDNGDGRLGARHKASDLCHQTNHANRPNVGGLSAHVWSSDDLQGRFASDKLYIIGNKCNRILRFQARVARGQQLDATRTHGQQMRPHITARARARDRKHENWQNANVKRITRKHTARELKPRRPQTKRDNRFQQTTGSPPPPRGSSWQQFPAPW